MSGGINMNCAVYRTEASGDEPEGFVVNNILWDGVSEWSAPDGCAVIKDPGRKLPIGSIYKP